MYNSSKFYLEMLLYFINFYSELVYLSVIGEKGSAFEGFSRAHILLGTPRHWGLIYLGSKVLPKCSSTHDMIVFVNLNC